MFARAYVLFTIALAGFASAAPNHLARGGSSNCNTGDINCCNSVQSSNSPQVSSISGLLGIPLQALTGNIGLGCTPITIIGLGTGANCDQEPVCCQGNQAGGLIGVNCIPVALNL
ncbi:hypothetical protein ID866_9273 [Astraeus odoratus]|nr:hypothetical protein ID866_9273 [Astraeus odoratus]